MSRVAGGWLTADWEVPWCDSTDHTAWRVHNLVHRIVVLGDYLVFQFTLLPREWFPLRIHPEIVGARLRGDLLFRRSACRTR